MANVAVSLIVEGSLKTVVMPNEMLSELAVKLREEGKCAVHTIDDSYQAEGFVVLGRGTKNGIMILPNIKD